VLSFPRRQMPRPRKRCRRPRLRRAPPRQRQPRNNQKKTTKKKTKKTHPPPQKQKKNPPPQTQKKKPPPKKKKQNTQKNPPPKKTPKKNPKTPQKKNGHRCRQKSSRPHPFTAASTWPATTTNAMRERWRARQRLLRARLRRPRASQRAADPHLPKRQRHKPAAKGLGSADVPTPMTPLVIVAACAPRRRRNPGLLT